MYSYGNRFWIFSAPVAAISAAIAALTIGAEARATIKVGSTTITSIGHYFEPPHEHPVFGTVPGVVLDFLVNQTQETGGGAVLPVVSLDLDTDTSIAYSLA